MAPPAVPAHVSDLQNMHWPSSSTMPDPFMETGLSIYRRWRSSSEDQSMPDYSNATTPASSRNITDNNSAVNKPGVGLLQEKDPFDDMLNASSPSKDGLSGYFAPANARVNSAAKTPPIRTKPSASAEARTASYSEGHARAVSITVREPPPAANREISDISMTSRFSDENAEPNPAFDSKIQAKPTSDVKGRKEGKGNRLEVPQKVQRKASARSASQRKSNEENPTKKTSDTRSVVSDSKRKRSVKPAPKEENMPSSSPSRKVSKTESQGSTRKPSVNDPTEEDIRVRAPLCSLENI